MELIQTKTILEKLYLGEASQKKMQRFWENSKEISKLICLDLLDWDFIFVVKRAKLTGFILLLSWVVSEKH